MLSQGQADSWAKGQGVKDRRDSDPEGTVSALTTPTARDIAPRDPIPCGRDLAAPHTQSSGVRWKVRPAGGSRKQYGQRLRASPAALPMNERHLEQIRCVRCSACGRSAHPPALQTLAPAWKERGSLRARRVPDATAHFAATGSSQRATCSWTFAGHRSPVATRHLPIAGRLILIAAWHGQ